MLYLSTFCVTKLLFLGCSGAPFLKGLLLEDPVELGVTLENML